MANITQALFIRFVFIHTLNINHNGVDGARNTNLRNINSSNNITNNNSNNNNNNNDASDEKQDGANDLNMAIGVRHGAMFAPEAAFESSMDPLIQIEIIAPRSINDNDDNTRGR